MISSKIIKCDPNSLKPNPWNPNQVDPLSRERLAQSIKNEGLVPGIYVRALKDGTLQIIGGQHRAEIAAEQGFDEVDVIHLGELDDRHAKKLTLALNTRYGTNDMDKLQDILSEGLPVDEMMAVLNIDATEFTALFEHASDIDLDDLEGLEGDDGMEIDLGGSSAPSQQILRFKMSNEDAAKVDSLMMRIRKERDFEGSDELTNAGDALVWLVQNAFGGVHG